MDKTRSKRALTPKYVSPNQSTHAGAAPCWLFTNGKSFSACRIVHALINRLHDFVNTQLYQHQILASQLVSANQ